MSDGPATIGGLSGYDRRPLWVSYPPPYLAATESSRPHSPFLIPPLAPQ